ncbi:hypothetical protein [Melittangium boletus]|uniref:hypothetical protein n=1 Tax=Melittangium boletus TaxID=83453 RepID=UPI003DA4B1D8
MCAWSLLLLVLYAWSAWGSPPRVPAAMSMSTPTALGFVLLGGGVRARADAARGRWRRGWCWRRCCPRSSP